MFDLKLNSIRFKQMYNNSVLSSFRVNKNFCVYRLGKVRLGKSKISLFRQIYGYPIFL